MVVTKYFKKNSAIFVKFLQIFKLKNVYFFQFLEFVKFGCSLCGSI